MNRRAFLSALGIGAAAVTLRGLPWPDPTPIVGGTVGAPAVNIATAFKVGDVFTIEGRFALNPITRKPTKHLQQFTVVRVVDDATITFSPAL